MLEIQITTKILPVGILQESFHHRLVTLVVAILQIMQSCHQSDWKSRTTKVFHLKRGNLLFGTDQLASLADLQRGWSSIQDLS